MSTETETMRASLRCVRSNERVCLSMGDFLRQQVRCPSCGRILRIRSAKCSNGGTLPTHNRPNRPLGG